MDAPLTLAVCVNRVPGPHKPCCGGRGALALADALEAGMRERRLNAAVKRIVCFNRCLQGPNLRIVGAEFFHEVTAADIPGILAEVERRAGRRPGGSEAELLYPGG